jgi:hypothetical protein
MQEHGNEQNFPFNMQNRIHRSEEPDKEQRAIKRPKEQKKNEINITSSCPRKESWTDETNKRMTSLGTNLSRTQGYKI